MTGDQASAAPRPSRRRALGFLGGASLATAGAVLAPPSVGLAAPRRPGRIPEALLPGGEFDRFLAQRAEADQFSGTVLLAHGGHPALVRSFGMADKSRSIPNRRDTIFNLASVTKSLTAIALGQLVQAGKVHLHDTLGSYLDGFTDDTSNVTIHQLLTHTAGMRNYSTAEAFQQGLTQWQTAAEMMDGVIEIIRAMETRPSVTPGTTHVYSNSGYFVLGAIVANVSGLPYHDYIRQHVVAPARMRDSNLYTRPEVLTRRDIAHPYWTQPTGNRVDFTTTDHFGFVGGPAEGIYSTAFDLLEFSGALRDGRLLIPAFAELFTSGKVPLSPADRPVTPAQARFYGYGFRIAVTGGQLVVGHSGSGPGTATNIDIYPHLDWIAVVLSNYDSTVEPIVQKARELITRLGG